jgi:hypothetical protein
MTDPATKKKAVAYCASVSVDHSTLEKPKWWNF